MAARIDIPSIYDEVRKVYAGMGYPVSGDRLVVSEQPTYVDGRPVPKDVLAPNSSGGNTQDDGTVRVNPRYRAVMRHWGLKGSGRDFLRTIIGHELGHHVDRTVLSRRSAERRRLLREIRKSGFHTVYTDSYGPDTDPRKLDKELLAEYLAKQVADRPGKSAESAIDFPDDERDALSRQKSIVTHRVSDDARRFKAGDVVRAPWGSRYVVSAKDVVSRVEDSPYYDRLTEAQRGLLRKYRRIAILRLSDRLGKSASAAEFRDGTYDDVKAVYDALSDREKDLITPGRTVYKDVPVLSRTVAYDGDAPVGFADWYGKKGRASLCVAVSDRARGQGLAGKMAIDSIRKILAGIRAEREQAEREGGDALREWRGRFRLRNFVWGLARGNDASARAAEKAGFHEQVFKRLRNGRRFVLSRSDVEKLVYPDSSGKES